MNERAVSPARSPRAHVLLGGLAFVFLLLEWVPGFAGEAGYFIDELYYLACAQRPDFGYVDHPPLSVWLLGAVRAVLGDSLAALHLGPALAGAATVLVVGDTARRLGAGRFGQGVAAVGVMAAPIYQILFGFWSMNAFSMLIWAAALRILVEIERNGRTGLWVAFGLVMGLGIENKHTIMLLALGLAAGFLLTPARRHLAGRGPWMALGIAALLALPNLAWQAAYGWPSLEFYRNADLYKNLPTPPLAVLGQQVLMLNPLSLPIWLAGLAFLLGTRAGRPWRHLGLAFVVLLVVMVAGGKSRPDRIAGAYTILFAAGACCSRRGRAAPADRPCAAR